MSRRLVLGLSLSIAVLLLSLSAFLYFFLREPTAVDLLFDGTGDYGVSEGLNTVTNRMHSPLSRGGSVDNLFHFLSKEPGRKHFVRQTDRRRANSYLSGVQPEPVSDADWPPWVPDFVGGVDFLFNNVLDDLLPLLEVPDGLFIRIENRKGLSILRSNMETIELFGANWLSENTSPESAGREAVREFLLANRKFLRIMKKQDGLWVDWSNKLQELSTIDNWRTAVSFVPQLENELNELRVALLAADIHRRTVDLLSGVPSYTALNSLDTETGLTWWPAMSFYKNLPEITGVTADNYIFFIKLNIGFENADNRTSAWIIAHKIWLNDFLKSYFSKMNSKDFSALREGEKYTMDWKIASIKADIINHVNSRIILDENSGFRRAKGIRELAFSRINVLNYN